jgi:hypothetical protein
MVEPAPFDHVPATSDIDSDGCDIWALAHDASTARMPATAMLRGNDAAAARARRYLILIADRLLPLKLLGLRREGVVVPRAQGVH